jgi:uncharacterized membrane protein YadS
MLQPGARAVVRGAVHRGERGAFAGRAAARTGRRLVQLDTLLLATAMAAMGLRTSVASLRRAGVQPLKLGALLFVFLTVGGYVVNAAVLSLF